MIAAYPTAGSRLDPSWAALETWIKRSDAVTVFKTVQRINLANPIRDIARPWYRLSSAIFELIIENDADYDGHFHTHCLEKTYPDHDLTLVYNRMIPFTIEGDYHSDIMFTRLIRGDAWVHIDVRYNFTDECWLTVAASSENDAKFLYTVFTLLSAALS